MNPTAAIVSGVIFGTIFVLTCIISAVKAVRDRKRIKQRIAEKNRLKQQTGSFPRQNGVSIEEIICVRDDSRARRLAQLPDGGYAEPSLPPPQNGTYPNNWDSKNGAYSGKNGVDNLTYSYSSKDIKQKQETLQMPLTNQVEVEILPPNLHPPTKRSHSA